MVVLTAFYSNYLTSELKTIEKKHVDLYVDALKSVIHSTDPKENLDLESLFLEKIDYVPLILENDKGFYSGFNFVSDSMISDQKYLEEQIRFAINSDKPILMEGGGYAKAVYYQHSNLFKFISFFPILQVLLLILFLLIGYFFFSASRRAEQNQVWVGMSKETAHQLGTPVSSMMAWLDFLKETAINNPEQLDIISELDKDVKRLDLIADRFSKIGAIPKLEKVNIYEELIECKNYMEKRAARKIQFNFPSLENDPIFVNINKHLFDWVIENLLRNALDSMDGVGTIDSSVKLIDGKVSIDISDTGSGIPASNFRTVFQPGFTTKKRGWGLGLTLAKRIIEEYHHGKIIVKSSVIDKGTCFNILLPLYKA